MPTQAELAAEGRHGLRRFHINEPGHHRSDSNGPSAGQQLTAATFAT